MSFAYAVREHVHCAVQHYDRPFKLAKVTENNTIPHEAPCHVWMIPKSLLSYLDYMLQEGLSLKKPTCLPEYISKMSINVNDVRVRFCQSCRRAASATRDPAGAAARLRRQADCS